MTWLLDLDGVVWLADEPIPGSVGAVAALRRAGTRVVFVTNNSSTMRADYLAKLARLGMPTDSDDLITSAQAAASLLSAGERVLLAAGPGAREAAEQAGAVVTDDPRAAETVLVGWHRDFDFDGLTAAAQGVWAGARLVGTNDDATYPTPDGPLPGGGSILAAIAYATGASPTVAGKPNPPMADLINSCVDDALVFVGDRPSTDGLMAQRLGVAFALVRSGVDEGATSQDVAVSWQGTDLAAAVAALHQN
ncbi:MAG: HAD-IIA family hydrolase [Acidimicrobiales bacterium]